MDRAGGATWALGTPRACPTRDTGTQTSFLKASPRPAALSPGRALGRLPGRRRAGGGPGWTPHARDTAGGWVAGPRPPGAQGLRVSSPPPAPSAMRPVRMSALLCASRAGPLAALGARCGRRNPAALTEEPGARCVRPRTSARNHPTPGARQARRQGPSRRRHRGQPLSVGTFSLLFLFS